MVFLLLTLNITDMDMKLKHKSGRIFTYIGEYRPQFSNEIFVRLLNEKTGKEERFLKKTYLNYFTIIN